MSGSSDQLAEVYKQVESYFQGHPVIIVQPTKGDPPDQYTITYSMAGIHQSPDGDIIVSNEHIIELSIPFGFPHFPPSCKPKSKIFHPDFDPAAICLGDTWEQNASLAHIILYIGKMINGETFSTKNAFNDDAAKWYIDNASKFPLNAISWGGELQAQTDEAEEDTVDTLGEDDLSSDIGYLTLDNTDAEPAFPSVNEKEQDNLDLLLQLKFQKRFHEISKNLRTSTHTGEEFTELADTANQEIQKCKSLYQEAKTLENLGSAAKAVKRFEVIKSIVSDYPSIESDIKRVQQTLELLKDLDPDHLDEHQEISAAEPISTNKKSEKNKAGKETKQATQQKRNRKSFFDKGERRSKVLTFVMVGLGIVGISGSGLYYSHTGSILTESEQKYQQCNASLKAAQFQQAKQTCENGKSLLDNILLFHQADSNILRTNINQILLSETLTNGLEGKTIYEGIYLTKQQIKEFGQIKEIVALADSLFSQGKWQEASEQYSLLQEKVSLVRTYSPDLLTSIEENKFLCLFQLAIESVDKFIAEEQWHLAIGSLSHTQSLLSGLPAQTRTIYKQKLQDELSRCKFEIALKTGESAFDRGNWHDAIISYESCLDIARTYSAIKATQIRRISNVIDRSKLYLIIEQGNSAFALGSWNKAIEAYAQASATLADNQTLIDEAKRDINRKKLGKIILQASIIRDKQTVKSQLKNKQLYEAGKLYNQILNSIEGSKYSEEEEFIKARQEIHSTLADLNEEIYISEKKSYLHDNYQTLFISNYTTAVRENLIKPAVSYVKEVTGKLIFRMQCTEKRRGSRPLTLVMFYAYDKTNGQWELSAETSGG